MTFDPEAEAATKHRNRKAKSESNGKLNSIVFIEVPLGPMPVGYVTDRVEVTSLTTEQAEALNRLTAGLRLQNARCRRRDARTELGIVVDREVDAIRWLLDQIAAG